MTTNPFFLAHKLLHVVAFVDTVAIVVRAAVVVVGAAVVIGASVVFAFVVAKTAGKL